MAASPSIAALESELRGLAPAGALSEGTAALAVDGIVPSLTARPTDITQVAGILQACDEHGAAVIARGGGNHSALGMPPARFDLALDLSALNRIAEYEPADLTVTVEAGVLLSQVQETLAAHGQWLPLDPPGDGSIGGLLAANRSGPARMAFGSARDLVIGLEAATAAGHLVKSGGRVVKNVAGYDLAKLHIGGLGSLGVIVQATFKVVPLPAAVSEITLAGPLPSLMSTSLQVRNRGLAAQSLVLRGGSEGYSLQVRLAGGSAAVDRSRRETEAIADDAGLSRVEAGPAPGPAAVRIRASARPTSVANLVEAFTAAEAAVEAYPTAGIVIGRMRDASPATVEALRSRCVAAGGALVLEDAPQDLKRAVGVWGLPGADFALMQRLKQQFDPNDTLSPGRFVGGL